MTNCNCKAEKYIDYNCYSCLKSRFHRCDVTDNGQLYLNSELNSMSSNIHNITHRKDLLEWIVKHLACTSVFWDVDTNIACKYINFWLNEKFKGLYSYGYKLNFKNYEDFVEKFYTKVEGYKSFKSCTNNIKLLDNDDVEYKKIDNLYTLYNEYDELKKIHPHAYITLKTCKRIQTITILANDIAHTYKDDDKFIKVLKDLREIIKKADESYQTLCKPDLKQLETMVTDSAFPPRKLDPSPPQVIQQSPDPLEQPTHQALAQHVSGNGIRSQPEPTVDLQESSPTGQLRSEEHHTNVSHGMTQPEESPLLELPFSAQQANSRHAGNLREDVFKSAIFPRERNEKSRGAQSRSTYTGYNSVEEGITAGGVITPTDDTQSYLETFKGTITGVLGSVDPGPVLGVSGGMGALFLLFRYTPVGSFFGGRRGRFRQIPRTFGGFPPGEFPNFQDYEGGYIGYGPTSISPLAE
ncbi:Plasmodium vivax Vir protein, putative [Plasmodium vivax]|uniref:Vir protein, putative n=1 Tax=Plasmodium vivax TaxID=5855 RepID=A0A1G4EBI1_PLAVI|nr:Plasmodium vivax Vir protein, putative [Plasmodium vivax]